MSALTKISPAADQEVACTGRGTKTRGELKLTFTCRGIDDQHSVLLLETARGFDHVKSVRSQRPQNTHQIVVIFDISRMERSQVTGFANNTISNMLRAMDRALTGNDSEAEPSRRDAQPTYVNATGRGRRHSRR